MTEDNRINAMDERVDRRPSLKAIPWIIAAVALFCCALYGWNFFSVVSVGSLEVETSSVTFSEVTAGRFENNIGITASFVPHERSVLSSSIGGLVTDIRVNVGTRVKRGFELLVLTNPQIELDLVARQSEIAQQSANMNSQKLADQQAVFNYRKLLHQARLNLTNLEANVRRNALLVESGFVAPNTNEQAVRDLEAARQESRLLEDALSSFQSLSEESQRRQRVAVEQLNSRYEYSKAAIGQLNIRAPIDGVVMTLSVDKGQYISPGMSLGSIGDDSALKLLAYVDEFYLGKVHVGQIGSVSLSGTEWPIEVVRVAGSVKDRVFEVELQPTKRIGGATIGQGVQVSLSLGNPRNALVLPIGPYLEGQNSMLFVQEKDGLSAVKRAVKFGDRNSRYITIESGVSAGQKIITSSYREIGAYERIQLK